MLFRQFVDEDLGCASYLVGDEDAGEAVLVDPGYAIEPYLKEAERQEVRVVRVLETHTHADHVSGHGRLALEHGLPIGIHPAANVEYPCDPFEDGDAIDVGAVSLRVLHTPGHRPEHCCFAVVDRSRAEEPWLVLTGDSLFVGEAARPDLAVAAVDGAEGLFRSLRRLAELQDGVEVFPGHVAGSLCGTGMSSRASSTIGFERRFNPAFATTDEQEFVAESVHVSTPRPPTMERVVEINRGPFLGAHAPLERLRARDGSAVLDVRQPRVFARGHLHGAINIPLRRSGVGTRAGFVFAADEPIAVHAETAEEAEEAARRLRAVGLLGVHGYLLDVRQPRVFARGHLHGAINIPLRRSGVGTRAGFVFAPDEPIVLHAETAAEAQEAARRLWAVGLLDVHGYLVDVPATETLEPVGVDELERLLAEDAVDVIDVREKAERDAGYIPGSRHIPYRVIRAYGEEAADGKPVVTICESGARATLAASILAAAGIDARPILDGGVRDWQARGHRLVHFRRCGR